MKRALLGLLVGCMTIALASVAMAGDNQEAGISLHIQKGSGLAKISCGDFKLGPGQGGAGLKTSTGVGCPSGGKNWDIWVVVCNGSDSTGVGGMEFGIDYNGLDGGGLDVWGWNLCADLNFPSDGVLSPAWPKAGSGNVITWDFFGNCQNLNYGNTDGVVAVGGVLRAVSYGADVLKVTPRPISGETKIADCSLDEDVITDFMGKTFPQQGFATFCSNVKGYNFCENLLLPTQSSTWGKIKSQY